MSVDLEKEDGGRRAVRLGKKQDEPELLEGIGAGNIGVENEERRVILLEDLSSKSKGTSWRFQRREGRRSALISHLSFLFRPIRSLPQPASSSRSSTSRA